MFPGNLLVLMADGYSKRIDAIKPKDLVVSHLGISREVLDVRSKEYSGTLIKFDVGKRNWVMASEDARFLFKMDGFTYGGHIREALATSNRAVSKCICFSGSDTGRLGTIEQKKNIGKLQKMLKITESSETKKKTVTLYQITVEEEHSFLVYGYAGEYIISCKSD